MAVPHPDHDPEQTERLLFLSSQADDNFSTTINDFYASVRRQCQATAVLHFFASGSLSPLQTNQLVVASQEANTSLEVRMRALYRCFEEQKTAKSIAVSALAMQHGFFRDSNALLLKECKEIIAQDTELQQIYSTTQRQCENLGNQVATLESERTDILNRATAAEEQQNILQVHIDHRIRQYNQSQTSVLGLQGQVQQLERSQEIDHTKFEDEKRRCAELQTSIGQLQSNVETLERALSQSNDCLKVHVAHVDTQQTTNDDLKRQVHELEGSLKSSRKELHDHKRETISLQDAARGLGSHVKELEQTLQSTKDCLAVEKSLSSAGQASTATSTMKVQELENSLSEARRELTNAQDRHVARQQNLEGSLQQSNDSLEVYMDRCNSQVAAIDRLSHEAKDLERSLGVAGRALEDERQQCAIRQASVEDLETTAKQLEVSLHFASDCLQDEKCRRKMYQASIASLIANVRTLKQSLHLVTMDLENHKRQNQNLNDSAISNVQKIEGTLGLARKDLEEKTMRCMAQEVSMLDLGKTVQDLVESNKSTRSDLKRSRQRCNTQQASIISLGKIKHELERSLQASRDNLKAKAQLYSSQQLYIDSLKDTERDLQRSLQSSQRDTQVEKDRCNTQQSLIAEMEKELQELKVELDSTRGKVEHAEQLYNAQDSGLSDLNTNTWHLENAIEADTAETDLAHGHLTPDNSNESQPIADPAASGDALATTQNIQVEAVIRLQSELIETTESLQLYQDVVRAITDHSLERHMHLPCIALTQDLSKLRRDSGRETEVVRNCPALLKAQTETRYNFMVLKTILQQLLSDKDHRSYRTPNKEPTSESIEVPSRFLGTRYPRLDTKEIQDRASDQYPILYEESCEESNCDEGSSESDWDRQYTNCQRYYVVKYRDKVCLNATQTKRLRTLVWDSAQNAHWNAGCSEWRESTTRVVYPGESEEKTLAGLNLIEQIVDSILNPPRPRARPRRAVKSCPPDPLRGLRVIKQRVALYWYECYATAGAKNAPSRDDTAPQTDTTRKRHNSEELDDESQRRSKRHAGLSAADAIEISNGSDTNASQLDSEIEQDQRHRDSSNANDTESGNASDVSTIQSDCEYESDRWSRVDEGNAVSMSLWTLSIHQPMKMRFLEYIRRSPWARDTREGSRQFVKSLTPALNVKVLSRLATLSSTYPVQQVVLQINLTQLDQMLAYLDGCWVIPVVSNGFKIGESHIKSFSKLCFSKSRMNELLDYPLNTANFNCNDDERTLGFHSSGRFKVVLRRDPPTAVLTLRERFDTETIASMQVSESTGPDENESSGEKVADRRCESDSDSGDAAEARMGGSEHASDTHAQVLQAERSGSDREDGSSTSQIRRPVSRRADSPRGRTQTCTTLITASSKYGGGGGGGNKRAESNDQPGDASKNQDTAGAHSRPKRTPKPSRRAAEAASTKY